MTMTQSQTDQPVTVERASDGSSSVTLMRPATCPMMAMTDMIVRTTLLKRSSKYSIAVVRFSRRRIGMNR